MRGLLALWLWASLVAITTGDVVLGERMIEIDLTWRAGSIRVTSGASASIGNLHDLFAISHRDAGSVALFRADGEAFIGLRTDFNLWSRDIGVQSGVTVGDHVIEIDDRWRLGTWSDYVEDLDAGSILHTHLSVSHRDGQTPVIWRSDGTVHNGPRVR